MEINVPILVLVEAEADSSVFDILSLKTIYEMSKCP
jgi:hypothetical protein